MANNPALFRMRSRCTEVLQKLELLQKTPEKIPHIEKAKTSAVALNELVLTLHSDSEMAGADDKIMPLILDIEEQLDALLLIVEIPKLSPP